MRSLKDQEIAGEVLVTKEPITLLGFVDAKTGKISQRDHELHGKEVTGKILVFPRGVGSTVGPYTLINMMKNQKAPLAIINRESDQGTVAGCSVCRIPLVYGFNDDPTIFLKNGDWVKLSITKGHVTLKVVEN